MWKKWKSCSCKSAATLGVSKLTLWQACSYMGIFKSPLVMTRNRDSVASFCEHGDDLSRCTKDGFLSLSKQLSTLKKSFVSRDWLGNYSVIAYGVICFIDTKHIYIYICMCIILSLRSHFIRLRCMYFYAYYTWYYYKITLIATYTLLSQQ
jgi:hypothetical protein